MCPACVIGVVLAQLLAVVLWFQKVILKKDLKDKEQYWDPKLLLTPKMQAFSSNKKKVTITYIIAEIVAAIIIFQHGGFGFFNRLWLMLQ